MTYMPHQPADYVGPLLRAALPALHRIECALSSYETWRAERRAERMFESMPPGLRKDLGWPAPRPSRDNEPAHRLERL